MNEEILKILNMVKEETITAEQGEKLISAITNSESGSGNQTLVKANSGNYSMLRVRVDANDSVKHDKAKVSVNIPLSIAKKVASLVMLVPGEAKDELKQKGIDLDDIDLVSLIESFENGEITEDLVNVDAGEGEEKVFVRVYVD